MCWNTCRNRPERRSTRKWCNAFKRSCCRRCCPPDRLVSMRGRNSRTAERKLRAHRLRDERPRATAALPAISLPRRKKAGWSRISNDAAGSGTRNFVAQRVFEQHIARGRELLTQRTALPTRTDAIVAAERENGANRNRLL